MRDPIEKKFVLRLFLLISFYFAAGSPLTTANAEPAESLSNFSDHRPAISAASKHLSLEAPKKTEPAKEFMDSSLVPKGPISSAARDSNRPAKEKTTQIVIGDVTITHGKISAE